MPQIIPLVPSEPFYRFDCAVNERQVVFDVRWNSRDGAWYFDLLELDLTPIYLGAKIVLGTFPARRATHPLLTEGAFVVVDTSREMVEATFDDMGVRILLTYYTAFELAQEIRSRADELGV